MYMNFGDFMSGIINAEDMTLDELLGMMPHLQFPSAAGKTYCLIRLITLKKMYGGNHTYGYLLHSNNWRRCHSLPIRRIKGGSHRNKGA